MITIDEIQNIMHKVLQEGVIINFWSYVIFGIITFIASFLGGYLKRKGENVATKEDVKKITDEIESVKHEYAKDLHINQIRYEKEFEILLDLTKKMVKLRDAILRLQPTVDAYDPNEPEQQRKQRRFKDYQDAAKDFYEMIESHSPFYPEEIYQALNKVQNLGWKEAVRYQLFSQPNDGLKGWDEARKNQKEISQLGIEIIAAIRQRIKYWEKLSNQ